MTSYQANDVTWQEICLKASVCDDASVIDDWVRVVESWPDALRGVSFSWDSYAHGEEIPYPGRWIADRIQGESDPRQLRLLASLDFEQAAIDAQDLYQLFSSAFLDGVRILRLRGVADDEVLCTIANNPAMQGVLVLEVQECELTRNSVAGLIECGKLAQVKSLLLGSNQIALGELLPYLSQKGAFDELEELQFYDNPMSDASVDRFIETAQLPSLKELDFSGNGLAEGIRTRLCLWAEQKSVRLFL
jgi:hypothetical protein